MNNRSLVPAGGILLEELTDELFRASYNERFREWVKRTVVNVFIGGKWRKHLRDSMRLANLLLDQASAGLRDSGYNVVDLGVRLTSTGLSGTGSGLLKVLLEVGLEIDWLLGLPKYPGSTLKGALRGTIESVLGEEHAEAVLGSTGQEGSVGDIIVLDSYPVGCYPGYPCLVYTGDVVTPHYYKHGGVIEKEYQAMPVPVEHLAIAPGTVFRVVAGIRYPPEEKIRRFVEGFNKIVGGGRAAVNVPSSTYGYQLALAYLLASALVSGFAARSGKGYNIMIPLKEEELRNSIRNLEIVSIKMINILASKGPSPELHEVPHSVKGRPKGTRGTSRRSHYHGRERERRW